MICSLTALIHRYDSESRSIPVKLSFAIYTLCLQISTCFLSILSEFRRMMAKLQILQNTILNFVQ